MKVILLEDVENLGKKWEVKEVADGYARNFLIPKKLVKVATPADIEGTERLRTEQEARAKEELEKVEKMASQLDGYEVHVKVEVGEEGQLYAAVSGQKIAEALAAEGFDVLPKQIKIESPIKELGEFPVMVEFDHGLEAEIRVIVEAEA